MLTCTLLGDKPSALWIRNSFPVIEDTLHHFLLQNICVAIRSLKPVPVMVSPKEGSASPKPDPLHQLGVAADAAGHVSGVPSLQGGRTGSVGLVSIGRNHHRCSEHSGVLISNPVGNRNAPSTCAGGSPQSSARWGISRQAAISISLPRPSTCCSPGKCGMIRFSTLMSPDSMGNISFSAFCGAEPGTSCEDGTGICPCSTRTPACSLPHFPAVTPLPLACAGWTLCLGTGRNLPGEHRADGSPFQGVKEIEALGPRSLF